MQEILTRKCQFFLTASPSETRACASRGVRARVTNSLARCSHAPRDGARERHARVADDQYFGPRALLRGLQGQNLDTAPCTPYRLRALLAALPPHSKDPSCRTL